MLGLILIYFIGKHFYDLALEYGKNRWVFAITGVISYYAGTFIGGIIIGLIYTLGMDGDIESINDMLLNVMAVPFGLLFCLLIYRLLKSRWSKSAVNKHPDSEMLDQDLI